MAQQPAADASLAVKQRDEWRHARARVYFDDFGELAHYRAANARLGPPAAGEQRVVFFGDSITELWPLPATFPGKPYVNRGVSGQTTAQMLVRFRHDVIDLGPSVVVILAGTNDIAGNTGPTTLDAVEANFASMVDLSRAHGVRVVLSSVLPVHHYTPASATTFPIRPPGQIAALNHWLRGFAASNGCGYVDYTPTLADERGMLRRELADDGLHPGPAAFALMAPAAERAIAAALAARP